MTAFNENLKMVRTALASMSAIIHDDLQATKDTEEMGRLSRLWGIVDNANIEVQQLQHRCSPE